MFCYFVIWRASGLVSLQMEIFGILFLTCSVHVKQAHILTILTAKTLRTLNQPVINSRHNLNWWNVTKMWLLKTCAIMDLNGRFFLYFFMWTLLDWRHIMSVLLVLYQKSVIFVPKISHFCSGCYEAHKAYPSVHVSGFMLCVFMFVALNLLMFSSLKVVVLLITMTFVVCVGCVAYSSRCLFCLSLGWFFYSSNDIMLLLYLVIFVIHIFWSANYGVYCKNIHSLNFCFALEFIKKIW